MNPQELPNDPSHLPQPEPCDVCHGVGEVTVWGFAKKPDPENIECISCNGTGELTVRVNY